MTYGIDLEIDVNFDFDYEDLYHTVVNTVLDEEKCPYEVEVNLLITDNASIHEINLEQRNIDSATDVLSFPMNDFIEPANFDDIEENGTFNPESGELILGDIVLSIDRIISQAEDYGHSVKREFSFLIVHSMLHLIGYDHMQDDERIQMEERQHIIMDKLGILR